MAGAADEAYLVDLPSQQRSELVRVNRSGLARLRKRVSAGDAVAFVGAGASVPLYPVWEDVISELVDMAAEQMTANEARTCRELGGESPDAVVDLVRQRLGIGVYRELLREVFRVRWEPETGRTWTNTQELIVRCNFQGIVTTNYDPGIVDARMRVRSTASSTAFSSWEDELELQRWDTGDVFRDADDLPVLFAHGHHNRPGAIVLATTEYRRAYARGLAGVLSGLATRGRLVWIGFSFADERIRFILRSIAERTGLREDPGTAPRHVALMPWDPEPPGNAGARDPDVLRKIAAISYGADVILYPAHGADHSALGVLLEQFTDKRFPPVMTPPPSVTPGTAPSTTRFEDTETGPGFEAAAVRWVHGVEPAGHFAGRSHDLARLDRWAHEPEVRVIGVTAWGGAGKTALITQWLSGRSAGDVRPGAKGLFAWSFYQNPSDKVWARALLGWTEKTLEVKPTPKALAARAFVDLERFAGGAVRILEVPPLTPAEGSQLLACTGAAWVDENLRRELVREVDGHALAIGALAGAMANEPQSRDVSALISELKQAAATSRRVQHVLSFYAERLTDAQRMVVAIASLFPRPISTTQLLDLGSSRALGCLLAGWSHSDVRGAVNQQLRGLLSWQAGEEVAVHPLVRETFRPFALNPGSVQLASDLALRGLPAGAVRSREQALRVVETIELLIAADQWEAASHLFEDRMEHGSAFLRLPAAGLGQRCALAFVGTADGRRHIHPTRLGVHLRLAGLCAMHAGDVTTAKRYLEESIEHERRTGGNSLRVAVQLHLAACLTALGKAQHARDVATDALLLARANNVGPWTSHTFLGWACDVAGDTSLAERHFLDAELEPHENHIAGIWACLYAQLLLRTGRAAVARPLVQKKLATSTAEGWNDNLARCVRVLGLCDLADARPDAAKLQLERAATAFREGDFILELADTLVDCAEQRRRSMDLDEAERACDEAIGIAGPRELVPTHSAALAARARIRADRNVESADPAAHERARDDANDALRLATTAILPWHELDALSAHARIDEITGTDNGWTSRVRERHAVLVPRELAPDPLASR